MNDFHHVSRVDKMRGVRRARHDFAVDLDRDRTFVEPEVHYQALHRQPIGGFRLFTVHDNLHVPHESRENRSKCKSDGRLVW